jgi:ketol-acid reductoisomerase
MSVLRPNELNRLNSLSLGMFGFGAQGSAEATNLARSGVQFAVGVRHEGKSFEKVKAAQLKPMSFEEVADSCSHLLFNIADQAQGKLYAEVFKSRKKPKALIFPHGFASHFGLIPVEKDGPLHILIAPKGAASGLTRLYGTPQSLPAILAVKDHSGDRPPTEDEKIWIEALAKAMGCHPHRLIWARFQDETVCDLFSEQALLCGGVSELLRQSFEVLTEAGYQSDAAYYETLYELKLIVDLIWEEGIEGMRRRISPTARYGDITRGKRVIGGDVKERMKEVLSEIESGSFAREFLKEDGSVSFNSEWKKQASHPIEKIHKQLSDELKSLTENGK